MPAALLPSPPARPAPDPTEPSAPCDVAVEGTRVASAERPRARAAPPAAGAFDLDGEQIGGSRPPAYDELL